MTTLSPSPKLQIINANGPVAGALIYSYQAGTTTPLATYTDSTGGVPNTNPIVANSNGYIGCWLGALAYKLICTDGSNAVLFDPATVEGNVLWTVDNITASGGGSSSTFTNCLNVTALEALAENAASLVSVDSYSTVGDNGGGLFFWNSSATASDGGIFVEPSSAPATGRWQRLFSGNINPRWFGATGDGTTNDTAAFTAAAAYAIANNMALELDNGTFYLATQPTLTNVPIIINDAEFKWANSFHFTCNPIIAISDTSQHFIYTIGVNDPAFPASTEIKTIWLTGLETVVINDNAGTWTAGSAVVTINGTAYTQSWTAKDASMAALAVQIATNAAVSSATYSATAHTITIVGKQGQALVVSSDLSSITGTMTFTVNSSGWTQHSLATQSDMVTAQQDIINIKGAVGQPIILTDFVIVSTVSGTWTAGTIYAAINGRQYSQAWGTSRDDSIGLLATQLSADSEVSTAVYTGGVLTITPKARKYLNFTTNVLAVTTSPATDTLAFSTVDRRHRLPSRGAFPESQGQVHRIGRRPAPGGAEEQA